MAVLADFQIANLCQTGMVQPFDPALVNPASLDVRLGNNILIEAHQESTWAPLDISAYTKHDPYLLRPGQFILADTVETFDIPKDICAQFFLKSSRAREGLQCGQYEDQGLLRQFLAEHGLEHLLAGWIDPGWHGSKLTLELLNVRQLHSIALWPEMKIGQIVFHAMDSIPQRCYAQTGRYNGDATVQASRG